MISEYNSNRPNLYRQLVDLIVWELNRASSIVDIHSQGAWAVYSKFVKHLVATESVVITFNYKAKEIIFIGYSLPPTDFMTEFMFRQAKMGHSQKQVTVISPEATDLRPRYEDIFGPGVCTIPKKFGEWFVGSEIYPR